MSGAEVDTETKNYVKSMIGKCYVVGYSVRNKHLIAHLSSGVHLWVKII